jgi:hypothetical protein
MTSPMQLHRPFLLALVSAAFGSPVLGAPPETVYPPVLPGGVEFSTDTSPEFLKAPATIRPEVLIAKTAPTVDFLFLPGQTYKGNPWSNWGDSLAVGGKYYVSIGDHLAPAGNAFVYEYDPAAHTFRQLADLRKTLKLPGGHYSPGKIHGRLDQGSDGFIYFSTHRGSTKVTTDEFHYEGDWIMRSDPASGKTEIVAHAPVPKHCIPCSVLDPQRLIFYGGTAPGVGPAEDGVQFFAYDVRAKKVLYAGPHGPPRYMMLAASTGRVYFTTVENGSGPLLRFDPAKPGVPEAVGVTIGARAATQETPDGFIYTVAQDKEGGGATIYAFNTKTEKVETLGPAAVGTQHYITSIDVDPTGRFLYYVPGAHGGSEIDGSPVIQFDVQSRTKKVVAFLHSYYLQKFGCTLKGTFSSAVDPAGDKIYVTWNNSRGTKVWDSCVLTVIHLPESERK